ncbi:MarR family transcriptional regulator [Hylemonella gracilis]|uniref:MarR family transcriptional regulator n=1 Tax=Hylemonella gracilis TaxID=80880 RepID=A0A4P6UE44_9BURK|nr:MarR family transcriptional regulator [Hylemonella gracilis]QBK03418.1 MarR family transcriptional regulator [Hylemonella gracilis]
MSQAPAPLPLERTFTYRLHLLHKVSDLETQQRYPGAVGLSLSDGRCLTAIGRFESLSVKDLARYANLNKSQASRAAQALVTQGLVSKRDSQEDGRGVTLALTAAGRKACARAMHLVHERNAEIVGCLTPAEQAQLSALLDRLVAHNQQLALAHGSAAPDGPDGEAATQAL